MLGVTKSVEALKIKRQVVVHYVRLHETRYGNAVLSEINCFVILMLKANYTTLICDVSNKRSHHISSKCQKKEYINSFIWIEPWAIKTLCATLRVALATNNCLQNIIVAQFPLFVCGHDLSTILIISFSCVIFWSQDTRLCNMAYKIFVCVHIYLHSGPLLAFFSTGQSFEHIQTQCVFERCDVKQKNVNDRIE